MTGEQCREARERLNWTRHELATATDVPLWFIAAFEDGRATPDFLVAYEVELSAALEAGTARAQGRAPQSGNVRNATA
jgi:ribosome-binding protein aMBF1 (putative translation factor)